MNTKLMNKLGYFRCQCCNHWVHSVEHFGAPDAFGAVCKRCGWEQVSAWEAEDPNTFTAANNSTLYHFKSLLANGL